MLAKAKPISRVLTFCSSRGLGYPHWSITTFLFGVIGGQEDLPLVGFRIALQVADAVVGRSHGGVEISGIDDVGLWEPAAGVEQFRARLHQPDDGGESADLNPLPGVR